MKRSIDRRQNAAGTTVLGSFNRNKVKQRFAIVRINAVNLSIPASYPVRIVEIAVIIRDTAGRCPQFTTKKSSTASLPAAVLTAI